MILDFKICVFIIKIIIEGNKCNIKQIQNIKFLQPLSYKHECKKQKVG